MQRQSQRMTQLVEDLLTLSRLESQRQPAAEETVAMAPMLATLRREAEALSQGRHEISVEDSAGVDLCGSNKELHSAFSNLVSNAVRYTPAGGTITHPLRARRPTAASRWRCSDTGYGIPAAHLPRITERFYRVSTSRSRESGGTGLGLSIVKHVLSLHQARLEIASEVGRGSTFSCHFGAERVRPRDSLDIAAAMKAAAMTSLPCHAPAHRPPHFDGAGDTDPLRDPALYFNRELSQLDFNFRVLAQAQDPQVPLLERLRYLCISCTNLDEFFEIRAGTRAPRAGLRRRRCGADGIAAGAGAGAHPRPRRANWSTRSTDCWNEVLRPALDEAGVRVLARDAWNAKQTRWLRAVLPRRDHAGAVAARASTRRIRSRRSSTSR